jgi:hypothetical protein
MQYLTDSYKSGTILAIALIPKCYCFTNNNLLGIEEGNLKPPSLPNFFSRLYFIELYIK